MKSIKKISTKAPTIIIIILFLLLSYAIYLLADTLGSAKYLPVLFNSEPSAICRYKSIKWNPQEYLITSNIPTQKITLNIPDLKEKYWNYSLRPIGSNGESLGEYEYDKDDFNDPKLTKKRYKRFTHCTASILSPDQNMPKDLKETSKGLPIDIYIDNKKTITFLFTISIDAYRFTDEEYNLNAVMEDVAKSFTISKLNNQTSIYFSADYSKPKMFNYNITKINDQYVWGNNLEFVSYDEGKTWSVVKK